MTGQLRKLEKLGEQARSIGTEEKVLFPARTGNAIGRCSESVLLGPLLDVTEGVAVFVACSTLCFGRHTFEEALRRIGELHFTKFEVAIHEHGRQMKPSEVAEDVMLAAARLRHGPGLAPIAFHVEMDPPSEAEGCRQFQAISRLARISAVPVITIRPSSLDVSLEEETARLTKFVKMAESDGILLGVATLTGTHTETPDLASILCDKVPGLGLTLDPSHYLTGPHQGQCFESIIPLVRHVHFRDTGKGPNQFQVRIGQGEVDYGRIITMLERVRYRLSMSVDIRDIPDADFAMEPEVRKLKYLLESLV